ncbi:hypothetical protein HPP92_014322 [Vanilla planifolia]|uniref:Choline transporter-like protein n=1 Tax=Vanilla planifolia TaxID=51239 RepID=A0A835QJT5_VANPL|nr:hypothetical protein HPP92_014322 [Vanilla planifolia]
MRGLLGVISGRHRVEIGVSDAGEEPMEGGIIGHNRKCRDVGFLMVFIAFWVAMIVNASFGFNKGNPRRLEYGLDYKGNVCGDKHSNPDLRELEIQYWMNPNQVYQSGQADSLFKLADARSICLMECPFPSEDGLNWVCDYPEGDIHMSVDDWIDRDYDYYEFLTAEMRNTSLQLQGPCYPVIFPSVNVYWSCQFIARASNLSMRHWQLMGGISLEENILIDRTIHKEINSRSAVLKRYVADIGKAWPVLIVCGWIVPLFLSIIWLLLIRHFVAGMTWITVILFNSLVASVTMFCYAKAGWIGHDVVSVVIGESDPYISISGREINHLRVAAVLMTILMIFSILSSIAIVRRLLLGTTVLKVAAKVIGEVQALIVFPVFPCIILGIFYVLWISAAMHLFSSGQRPLYSSYSSCHLISPVWNFWATQFIIACSSTVVAGSVASYYWARGDLSQDVAYLPVFASMRRLMRYNLGSVALGSLVLPFVEFIRIILESLRRKLKISNAVPVSRVEEVTLYSSKCVLGCVNWTLRSVNRSAYIMIAITGKGFCKASSIATGLIMNNILCIGKVNVIGDIILVLGKLCVSLFCAVFAFLISDGLQRAWKRPFNKFEGLKIVVEMSIDTIIISFCQDADEHQGSAQFAPSLLMETLDGQGEMQRLTQGS